MGGVGAGIGVGSEGAVSVGVRLDSECADLRAREDVGLVEQDSARSWCQDEEVLSCQKSAVACQTGVIVGLAGRLRNSSWPHEFHLVSGGICSIFTGRSARDSSVSRV